MYLIKTKGTGKVSDYIQLRDENFALISYFKEEKLALNIRKLDKDIDLLILSEKVKKSDYGKLIKV